MSTWPTYAGIEMWLAMLFLLLFGSTKVWAGTDSPPAYPSDQDAVVRFITGYHFERDIDRQNALSEFKQIDDLHLLGSSDRASFFYFPTAAGSIRGYVSLAVLVTGDVIAVGDEKAWNKVIAKINLVVESPEAAEALVKDFFHLTWIHATVWEGVTDGVNFIRSVDDIPFKPDDLENEVERLDLTLDFDIQPPSVQPEGLGYVFRGFSWQPYDGAVDEHVLNVARDGSVGYEHRNLAYPYGDYEGGCVVPLDSGPPMKVLERLAGHQGSGTRLLVARYLAMIARSDFRLYQSFIERNRDAITCLLKELQLDTDPEVRLAAIAALDVLSGERPVGEDDTQPSESVE